jgi:FMN reductase [NAD(P)H]
MSDNFEQKPIFSGYSRDEENPVLDVLLSHRSIRKFKDKPVPGKSLAQILTAAQRAPTSCNYQSYSIIAVHDRSIREQLRDLADHQGFVADCGVLLVFCADISRLVYSCQKQGYRYRGDQIDTLLAAHGDALIACQNASVAAESMGFGTCMLGNIRNNPQEVSDLLELPQYVFASVGLAVGYPDIDPGMKPRLSQRMVVSENRYSTRYLESDLGEYDAAMCRSGVYLGRIQPLDEVDPELEDRFTENDYGWMEHSARRISSCIQEQRRNFVKFLERKGFSCR